LNGLFAVIGTAFTLPTPPPKLRNGITRECFIKFRAASAKGNSRQNGRTLFPPVVVR
jgi:hypothetical protein